MPCNPEREYGSVTVLMISVLPDRDCANLRILCQSKRLVKTQRLLCRLCAVQRIKDRYPCRSTFQRHLRILRKRIRCCRISLCIRNNRRRHIELLLHADAADCLITAIRSRDDRRTSADRLYRCLRVGTCHRRNRFIRSRPDNRFSLRQIRDLLYRNLLCFVLCKL